MRGRLARFATIAVIAACGSQTVRTTPTPTPTTTGSAPAPSAPRPTLLVVATATATLRDLAGGRVGTATFTDTYSGVLVVATVTGLGLGAHGVHIHAVGKCESPFMTAGSHFNPDNRKHGFRNRDGPHRGDMPNIDMPAAGTLRFEFVLPGVTVNGPYALLGGAGTSIVIHSARDDHLSDPDGQSGGRLACGVIRKS
jgi:Cu-Zn family superoxide dismutase